MKISLNLLPEQLKTSQKSKARFSLAKKASVTALVVMVILTSSLFAYTVFDSFKIKSASQELEQVKVEVDSYKDKEALAAVLKTRLDTINTISQTSSPQNTAFNLLTKIIPSDIRVRSLLVDKSSHATTSIESLSTGSLDNLFNKLTNPVVHDGKISKTQVESLSRSQTGIYRSELNITFK